MLLIGSEAAKFHYKDFREPHDIDVITNMQELNNWFKLNKDNVVSLMPNEQCTKYKAKLVSGKQVEFELAEHRATGHELLFSSKIDSSFISSFHGELNCEVKVAPPAVLLAIKRSHLEFQIHWTKNIQDYHWLKNCFSPIVFSNIYEKLWNMSKARTKETQAWYKKPKIDLDMSNEDFFKKSQKSLGRIYNHDDIHKVVMFYDEPMYMKIKEDQTKAKCSKKLFFKLSQEDRIKCVQEEAMVIALERVIIPALEKDPKAIMLGDYVYETAIMRICTTLTKGWFRDFTIENYPSLFSTYDPVGLSEAPIDFINKFKDAKLQKIKE